MFWSSCRPRSLHVCLLNNFNVEYKSDFYLAQYCPMCEEAEGPGGGVGARATSSGRFNLWHSTIGDEWLQRAACYRELRDFRTGEAVYKHNTAIGRHRSLTHLFKHFINHPHWASSQLSVSSWTFWIYPAFWRIFLLYIRRNQWRSILFRWFVQFDILKYIFSVT